MEFLVTNTDEKLWEKTIALESVEEIAKKISEELETKSFFSLWLEGPLGAGKTTFTKELLYTLGLSKKIPVSSPTYTYLLEYKLNGKNYAHMDLYRFAKDVAFDEEELLGHQTYDGFILEWPSNVILPESMKATHKLHISSSQKNRRTYSFYVSSQG